MTYRELDYKATRLLNNGKITLVEYEEMTKPLDREIEQEPILDKIKQAREEMKERSYSLRCFNEDVFDEDERVVDLDNVLIILDKLIESEDKE